jgi:hypothetical protein
MLVSVATHFDGMKNDLSISNFRRPNGTLAGALISHVNAPPPRSRSTVRERHSANRFRSVERSARATIGPEGQIYPNQIHICVVQLIIIERVGNQNIFTGLVAKTTQPRAAAW